MNAHQLIFTSCRRGILGVNDGQQVYSFDECFPVEKMGLIQPLFSYRTPNLPAGVLMTEEIVPTFPKSFSYKKLEEGLCDLSLNTYLGKDYMGPTGRYGNFLSHHFVVDAPVRYPAEYFSSPDFRTTMLFEEVNQSEAPAHLSVLEPCPGAAISLDTVSEFLQEEGRIEVFKNMAACLLVRETPEGKKRILINDTQHNTIFWIAALHYLLPLRSAENVSFSTYLYNPMESDWDIVGVVAEDTLYQPTSQAYVFDLVGGRIPDVAMDEEFSDFIEVGFTIATDALEDFHAYLSREFPGYTNADEGMYGALAVYQMDTGLFDVLSLDQALDFLAAHGSHKQRVSFINNVFGHHEVVRLLEDSAMRSMILTFFNSLSHNAADLLDHSLNAEGYLLDLAQGEQAASVIWANFNTQMLSAYGHQSEVAYQGLLNYGRSSQVLELFTLFLKDAEHESPYQQFDKIIALLASPSEYPPFINAYFSYATDSRERMHLLEFIIKNTIAFKEAATLVREATHVYEYGKVPLEEVPRIESIWCWAYQCKLDIGQCGKLWGLITGIYLAKVKNEADLAEAAAWIDRMLNKLRLQGLPDDLAYLRWTVPKVIVSARGGVELSNAMDKLGFYVNDEFLDLVSHHAVKPYREHTWLKVAGYLYAVGTQRALEVFSEASKKLSDKELAGLDATIRRTYHQYPDFIAWWDALYELTQNTGMRKLKGLFKKKEDDSSQDLRGTHASRNPHERKKL